jgi:hypothetical protein
LPKTFISLPLALETLYCAYSRGNGAVARVAARHRQLASWFNVGIQKVVKQVERIFALGQICGRSAKSFRLDIALGAIVLDAAAPALV